MAPFRRVRGATDTRLKQLKPKKPRGEIVRKRRLPMFVTVGAPQRRFADMAEHPTK